MMNDNIKKIIILSLLIVSLTFGSVAFAETTKIDKTAVQVTMTNCVSSAVAIREAEIQTVFSNFSSTMTAAFTKRATDLAAAWALTEKTTRNNAIKVATTNFKQSANTAKQIYNSARTAAWGQFSASRIACKAPATGENSGVDVIQ